MEISNKFKHKINILARVLLIIISVYLFNKYVVNNWDYLKQVIANLFR